MCGICGFVGPYNENILRKMEDSLRHRGPDQEGHFFEVGVGLGIRRLSIIDTSEIKLPFTNEESSVVLAFNGEIYNYRELRSELEQKGHKFSSNCDAEVLVHLYEDLGEECVQKLNGMFAFAIWDKKTERLFLVRDRLGIKPLFYFQRGKEVIFASEINAILSSGLVKPEVDTGSMIRFINLRYNYGPNTLFKDIHRLEPAHMLIFSKGEIHLKRYWTLNPKRYRQPLKQLDFLLYDSVRLQLQSDVPLGIFLSGGLDSSTIAYYVKKQKGKVLSFSMDFFSNKNAEFASLAIGTRHHCYRYSKNSVALLPEIIRQFGEPLADPASIPTYLLAKLVSNRCKVILTGEGADEIFGGYEQYKLMGWLSTLWPLRLGLFRPALKMLPENIQACVNQLSSPEEAYQAILSYFPKPYLSRISHYPLGENSISFIKNKSLLFNMQLYDLNTFLPENNLFRLDMMLMASSIEGRVPFLDHRIVELAFGLPDNFRLFKGNDKVVLRGLMAGRLQKSIVNRRKQRWIFPTQIFFPKEIFLRIYSDKDLQKYFNMPLVYSLLSQGESIRQKIWNLHPLARLYRSRQLWNLLCFGVWYKLFVKGEMVRANA